VVCHGNKGGFFLGVIADFADLAVNDNGTVIDRVMKSRSGDNNAIKMGDRDAGGGTVLRFLD